MSNINLQLTVAGQVLNAKIQAGDGTIPLEITRIVTASGTSPDPLNLTDVVDFQQEFNITGRSIVGTRAIIDTSIVNFGNLVKDIPPLKQGYSLSQIGIFANDPDVGEILYRISQFENPNWVPAMSERVWELSLRFNFSVGNANEITIEVNPSGFVTKDEVDSLLQGFSPKPHASPTIEFGLGDGKNHGHLKLTSDPNSISDERGGTAATPAMVNAVKNVIGGRINIIESKVNSLTSIQIVGIVDTHAELMQIDPTTQPDGTLYLVRADENNEGIKAIYEVLNGAWEFFAPFEIELSNYPTIDMMNAAIQVAIASIDVSLLPIINANLGQRGDANATAVNTTNSSVSYQKGIFQHLLSFVSSARMALIDTINTNAARLTQARADSIDRLTPARATRIDDIGAVLAWLTAARGTSLDRITAAFADANNRFTAARATIIDNLAATAAGARVNMRVLSGVTTPPGSTSDGIGPRNHDFTISNIPVATRAFGFFTSNGPSLHTTSGTGLGILQIIGPTTARMRMQPAGAQIRWLIVVFD